MELEGEYRQEISESLFHAVKKYARPSEIEIAEGDGDGFNIELLSSPGATCAIELLPHEPSFQVHFTRPHFSLNNLTFTVSERDYDRLGIKTTRCFASADEAVNWPIGLLTLSCNVAQA